MDDTICAISTPIGTGGISIIRISGKDAIIKTNEIFCGKNLNEVGSHTINYGHIVDGGMIIDEVLVSVMKAPKTYTTEDVVEINVHGGLATTQRVLELLLEKGIRLAEPGEFTKRAFLNGRIDLMQAEAVIDIINADNENARNLSINQLSGKLSNKIRKLKNRLLEVEANIEVNIDYPEYEDIEEMTVDKVGIVINDVYEEIKSIIDESKTGKIIKNGINIAIIGRPNVGKSSILNSLLEEDKAIVTDIAGTTRDIVEGQMFLNGIKINFIDTAGIRETQDVVEKIGVNKSLEKLENADLIILVLDNKDGFTSEDAKLLERIRGKKHFIFVNKTDVESVKKIKLSEELIYGNTINHDGLDALKDKICSIFMLEEITTKDYSYITNSRQLSLIKLAKECIEAAKDAFESGMAIDLIEIDIRNARNYLSDVLGENYSDELINELFSKFCLGK